MFNIFKKCEHDWELISEKETQSQAEHYAELTGKVPGVKTTFQLEQMTSRKFIQLLKCNRCGKLKRFVESI